MHIKTLAVCGCSYSDYTGDSVDRTYGEIAARLINYDYLHLAEGCSSKDRAFKMIVSAVLDGRLRSGDIVVVQYPDPARMELPSAFNLYIDQDPIPEQVYSTQVASLRNSPFGKYFYHNWKPKLNDYVHGQGLDESFRIEMETWSDTYEKLLAVNERFILHEWQVFNHMLEAFCEKHGINLIHYMHRTTGLWHELWHEGGMTSDQKYIDTAFWDYKVYEEFLELYSDDEYWLGWDTVNGEVPDGPDTCHVSRLAHGFAGEQLAEHLLKHVII